jgi:hypothetical protein
VEKQNPGVRAWDKKHAQIPGLDSRESASKLVAQMKGEILMLVSESAYGFRTTIGDLWSLEKRARVCVFTLCRYKDDHCFLLLLKNLGKCIPEPEIREKLEALHITVQALMQLRSKRQDQYPKKTFL